MLRKLFDNNEVRIILIYIITTAIIYASFWIGYYFMPFWVALGVSIVLFAVGGALYAVFRKYYWSPMAYVFALSAGIGLAVSLLFIALPIVPSKFFGVVLLIMLGYKILQAVFGAIVKQRLASYIMLIVCLLAELVACIIVGVVAYADAGLYWQIFFALLLCFFYSCAQIYLRKCGKENFWHNAAIAYLLGFVFIFVLVVLLVISMLAEDGAPLGILFEAGGEGIGGALSDGITDNIIMNKKRK